MMSSDRVVNFTVLSLFSFAEKTTPVVGGGLL